MPNEQADENGTYSGACKTAFSPYDLALTAFLLIAQHHLGSEKVVRSDGEQAQREDTPRICKEQLGYGAEHSLAPDRERVVLIAAQPQPLAGRWVGHLLP